ncbi:MAG: DUF59 domain-containing protein [Streptosporangiales bacterium]|nr:DUF59 domain-containing protein [Streptosporangiales bacterium]
MDLCSAVRDALGTVRDPELDEPVTDLGFVAEITADRGAVRVLLRLPTYFCAPNFAYLMVADARDAVAGIPEVRQADIRLVDHFMADEINAGVAGARGFELSFPGLADGELAELRLSFLRKAHRAAQHRLCRAVLRKGEGESGLTRLRLRDVPECDELRSLRRRRSDLNLPAGPDAPLLVHDDGRPVAADEQGSYLRLARATRVSIDGNADLCRGLLATRYAGR